MAGTCACASVSVCVQCLYKVSLLSLLVYLKNVCVLLGTHTHTHTYMSLQQAVSRPTAVCKPVCSGPDLSTFLEFPGHLEAKRSLDPPQVPILA